MKKLRLATLITCGIVLAGCAATIQKPESTASTPPSGTAAPVPAAAPWSPLPAASTNRLVLNVTGSKISTDSKDWVSFKNEWHSIFQEQATAAGIKFEWQEGNARPLGEPGTLLTVNVNDYRFVGVGARIMFGIMTGNAYIDAQARFTNLQDGAVFSELPYNTSSSAGHGIFASMTPKQIYAIADDVIAKMKSR